MPVIPRAQEGTGRISESVGTPANIGFGAGAVEQATGQLGGQLFNIGAELVEKRTRALAKDFAVRKGTELEIGLSRLKTELQGNYPDGQGYSEEYEKRAKALYNQSLKGAPSNFADDFYRDQANNILSKSLIEADGFEHVTRAKVASRLIEDEANAIGNELLLNPNLDTTLRSITQTDLLLDSDKDDTYGNAEMKMERSKFQRNYKSRKLIEGHFVAGKDGNLREVEKLLKEDSPIIKYLDAEDTKKFLAELQARKKQRRSENDAELTLRYNDVISGLERNTNFSPQYMSELNKSADQLMVLIDASDKKDYVKNRMRDTVKIARDVNDTMSLANKLPYSAFNTLANDLVSKWKEPTLDNEIKRQQALGAFVSGMKAMNEERAKTPREYVNKNSPESAELYSLWQSARPGPEADAARDQYYEKSDAYGASVGMNNMRATTIDESKAYSAQLMKASAPELKAAFVQEIKNKYGDKAQKAIYEMTVDQDELDKKYAVVGALSDPTTAIQAIEAAKVNKTQVYAGTPRKNILDAVRTDADVLSFKVAMSGRDNSGKGSVLPTSLEEVITDAAALRVERGESLNAAISNAKKTILENNFTKIETSFDPLQSSGLIGREGKKSTVYVSSTIKGDHTNIQAFMDSHSGVDYFKTLDIPRGENDKTDAFYTGPTGMINRVRWANNEDATGIVLVWDDDILGPINVPNKDGTPIAYSFRELIDHTDDLTREAKRGPLDKILKNILKKPLHQQTFPETPEAIATKPQKRK